MAGENPMPVISLQRPEVRDRVKQASVVLGVDADGNETLFYGRRMLEDIARRGHTTEFGPQVVIRFAVDPQTDDPEYLCTAVAVLKGSCDYQGADG
jgi:hypothetical protein